MALFTYTGRNSRGDQVQGTLEGADSGSVADHLSETGITPTEIRETKPARSSAPSLSAWRQRLIPEKKADTVELMLFSRQMHTLLKAGVPIMRALAGLQESAQSPGFSAMLHTLRDNLDRGRELSASMRESPGIFSPFYVTMVQVGEMTGMLDEIFMRLFLHLEFEKEMNDRIRSAVRYPLFVLAAMAGAIVIVNLFVIPAFAKVFAGFHADLPLMTQILIGFSGFMVNFWPVLLAMIVAAVAGFRLYTTSPRGRYQWDRYKFRIPFAGKIMFKSSLARFARSLALAFKSGIPIVQGMNVVGRVAGNEYMRTRIEEMRDGIERGESILRTATQSGIFNPTVLQMIAVGEETGELDSMMLEVAEMYEREVEYDVKTLGQQIEPVLIIVLGVMVLILALGVFLPMWDLGKAAMHR
jgi:MSHA biogenesis protein MshG